MADLRAGAGLPVGAAVVAALLILVPPARGAGQDDVAAGQAVFRASCARCHGADARGFTGPDLAAAAARPDAAVRLPQVILAGVSGTDMPPAGMLSDRDVALVVAYVRSLDPPAVAPAVFRVPGDAMRGEALFWGRGGCGACHYVTGRGGRLGPDLSRGLAIGTAPGRDVAIAAVRRPSDAMTPGFVPITVVTKDGQTVRGIRKNEDTFSVQILDTGGRLRSFLKGEVASVTVDAQSVMPAYGPGTLSDADVDDLVRYLAGLREAAPKPAAGIR